MITDIGQYYADLLILQYKSKPKARAHIEFLTKLAYVDDLALELRNAFDIETAVGVQLDILAKYVGVTRDGYVGGNNITLDDDDFRQLIKLAQAKNTSGSSLFDIDNLLEEFFNNQIFVIDYQTMRLSYMLDSGLGSTDFVHMAISQGLLPKPMGVGIGSIIYAPELTKFFGFRRYEHNTPNNKPFNDWENYDNDAYFLSYDDTITL